MEEEEKASRGLVAVMLKYNFPASGETLVVVGWGGGRGGELLQQQRAAVAASSS